MNEAAWRRLLDQIRDGLVVPVVGPQLLDSLQATLARRLLELYGQAEPPQGLTRFRELNDAVTLLRRAEVDGEPVVQNPQDLYADVHEEIRKLVTDATSNPALAPTQAAIDQLAQIPGFRLFVTLTPDDLLARSLHKRCAVNEIVHSPELATSEVRDLAPDWRDHPGEVSVLYLFGRSCPAPLYAINDDDVLEYAHSMIAGGGHVPARFFGELQQHNLLLLGCNFPDWLSRLFLRITNKGRLSIAKAKREWLIEPVDAGAPLVTFLKAYSKDTTVMSDIGPREFVAELHKRWFARDSDPKPDMPDRSTDDSPPAGTVFFISYSRGTDRGRAENLVQALRELGVGEREVWFDRKDIEPGENFRRRILEGIGSCRYFLPLVSEAVNRREEGFVFREWRAANDRSTGMNRAFVHPLIVDRDYAPERYTAEPVQAWKEQLDFGHAPEGVPDQRTRNALQSLLRAARRTEAPA